MKPQTTLKNAKVIKQIGKWTVEVYDTNFNIQKKNIAVTDGWYVDYPVIFSSDDVTYDNPYRVPKVVKNWIKKNHEKLGKITRGNR